MAGALLLNLAGWSEADWADEVRRIAPDRDVRVASAPGNLDDVAYALAWKPEAGLLARLPELKLIVSAGAGIDHLASDPDLPDVPVVRFVDPDLTMRMSEYVVLHVLLHHRQQRTYDAFQDERVWRELPQAAANEMRIGIMGLGVLGQDAARKLAALGFQVAGWSRSAKVIDGIDCYAGPDELDAFLARTDMLVCLLPATVETVGLLDLDLFRKLAKGGPLPGPVLINAGRGAVQNEADILVALDEGSLYAATLDVFHEEPLSERSPLWTHARVTITPHNASVSDARAVSRFALRQIAAFEAGEPLQHVVDLRRGY